jgi:hypothetical protein
MKNCWHSDPTQRPTAQEIFNLTYNWYDSSTQEVTDQIGEADEIRKKNMEIRIKMNE